MATSQAQGSQTAVISTEHTLATITDAGSYVLAVDTSNMVLGDRTTFRVKMKVRSSGTTRLLDIGYTAHTQSRPVTISIPVGSVNEYVVTLEQTTGTGRVFEWEVTKL